MKHSTLQCLSEIVLNADMKKIVSVSLQRKAKVDLFSEKAVKTRRARVKKFLMSSTRIGSCGIYL